MHCHWIAGIDDGAPSPAEGVAMLRALRELGFDTVVATPHMRPGMFDNRRDDLVAAFERMGPALAEHPDLPAVELSSEHYFDDVVFERLLMGEGLPYPGERAVLLEFYGVDFPPMIDARLFDLRRRRLLPVIAHPERYRFLWKSSAALERLVDSGVAALLDIAALVGKYGRETQRCAERLLEDGLYHAACSDAHRAADTEDVARGMERVVSLYGREELDFLLRDGPAAILKGSRID